MAANTAILPYKHEDSHTRKSLLQQNSRVHISTTGKLAPGQVNRPRDVEIFHLAFKQFTQYLQVLIFQLLNSVEQFSNFLAMDLSLTSINNQQ